MDNIIQSNNKSVSYSQLSTYTDCQYKWFLNYVKGIKNTETNIHLIFGTSMHSVLQNYLEAMYNTTIKEAECLDLNKLLMTELSKNFLEYKDKTGKNACSKEELMEFYEDGIQILDFFKKNRDTYFNKKGYELIGIEIPLEMQLSENIMFNGYIDIAIKDIISNKIKIVDFKTSTMGWRDYIKKDESKTSQILLYKKFYSDKFNVPIESIDVEFLILKRKLYENADFPQKRIQRFSPSSGTPSINKTINRLNEFINSCFTEDGEYRLDRKYLKSDDEKKCRFCEFNNNKELCDKKN